MNPRRRALTTAALLVGTFLASLDMTVVGASTTVIVGDLGGLPLYGWVFGAYMLTSTTTMPLYGKLADLWGRKTAYLLGAGIFVAASVVAALAWNMPSLVAARALQGLGAGAIIPVTMTIFGDLYPVEQRARLQGLFSLVWGVSSVLGPVLGGAIVTALSWHWVFLVNLPVGGVACTALALALREEVPRKRARIDVLGAALLTAAIVALLASLTALRGGSIPAAVALGGATGVLAWAFVRVERKAPDPVVPLELFADRVVATSALAGLFLGAVLVSQIAYVPLLARAVHGRDVVEAGAALVPMSLSWTTAAFVAGRAILRVGYRPTLVTGTTLATFGTAGVAAATAPGLELLGPVAGIVTGLGMGLAYTALNVVVQERVSWERRGAATALVLFARSMGGAIASSSLGLLLAALLARALAGTSGGEVPSEIVDPDRWSAIPPAQLGPLRVAMQDALGIVLACAAALGLAAWGASLAFPRVAVGHGAREDRHAPSLPE